MLSPNPQTQSGTGGAGFISAPPTDDPNFQVDPVAAFGLPQNYMLPSQMAFGDQSPAGAFTDSTYYADDASLRQQLGSQYSTLLQQLGYQDPNSGAVIPGSVIQDANIKMAQYQQQLQDAARSVTGNLGNNGTYFSGQRGVQLEAAQRPYVQGESQLGLDTGRSLQDIYHQAQGLTSQYNTQQNQYLAQAAQRNLAAIQAQQLIDAQHAASSGGGQPQDMNWDPNAGASGDANIAYAQSPVGQQMIGQVQAHPASAGSSGAAQTLLAAGQGRTVPNYQARKNAW
jgi:hypothetical protein